MWLLHTDSGWAQQENGDADRIRQLEEELLKLQQERLKKALEDIKKEARETRSLLQGRELELTRSCVGSHDFPVD